MVVSSDDTYESLRAQISNLSAQVEHGKSLLEQKDMIQQHLMHGVRVLQELATKANGSHGDHCPDGSWLSSTASNPEYHICVRFHPHVIDRFVTAHGHWGQCARLREIIVAIFTLRRQYKNDLNDLIETERTEKTLLIVDVGANIGVCSMLFASMGYAAPVESRNAPHIVTHGVMPTVQALKTAHVLSIEPDPDHSAMLRSSITASANQQFNVSSRFTVVDTALGDRESGYAVLKRFTMNSGANTIQPEDDSALNHLDSLHVMGDDVRVEMTTLDRVLHSFASNQGHIDQYEAFLKIDVEGYESKVLRGARESLQSGRILGIIMEFGVRMLRSHGDDPLDLLHYLISDCHFLLFCVDELGCEEQTLIFSRNSFSHEISHGVRPIDVHVLADFVDSLDSTVDLLLLHSSWISVDQAQHALSFLPMYVRKIYGSK